MIGGRGQAVEQETLLRVNAVGRGLLPPCVPLKPTLIVAPGASDPLYDMLVAVTAAPVCVQVADHP